MKKYHHIINSKRKKKKEKASGTICLLKDIFLIGFNEKWILINCFFYG